MLKFFRCSLRHCASSLLISAAPTSLPFLFLFSSYLTLDLFSPPCPLLHLSFYLNFSRRSGRNCLLFPSDLSGYNGSPDTRFSRGTTRLMSWPDEERYSCLLQSLVVSLLFSLVSTLLFSRTGDILSHLNSSTHRFPQFPPRNLCSLVTLAALSRLRCNGHNLLLSSYLSRIGRIENPSCVVCGHSSQDNSHLILHFPLRTLYVAHTLATLSFYNLWSKPWRVAELLGLYGLPPCPHPSERFG